MLPMSIRACTGSKGTGRTAGSGSRIHNPSFNGAIAFQRWKEEDGANTARAHLASMGPSPFSDGRHPCRRYGMRCKPASMGPSPFSDGRLPEQTAEARRIARFNGAIAFQRWKDEPLRHSMRHPLASMGPSPFSDGRVTIFAADDDDTADGFNGAIAFQRWKVPSRPSPRPPWPRFNGAIAFQRWKLGHPGSGGHLLWLQWGHRLSAMEGGFPSLQGLLPGLASMGPSPFSDGRGMRGLL